MTGRDGIRYVSYTQLKVWIATQERWETRNGVPAPLTDRQRRAMADLVPPPVAPVITPEEAANVDWISRLQEYINAHQSTTPEYKDSNDFAADGHTQKWRVQCRLPKEAPDQWFPPDMLGRRRPSDTDTDDLSARSFPKKKDAKQFAARLAVEWLMANHLMPKDIGTVRFERESTPLENSVEQPRVTNVYSPSPRSQRCSKSPEPATAAAVAAAAAAAGTGATTATYSVTAIDEISSRNDTRPEHSPPTTNLPLAKKQRPDTASERVTPVARATTFVDEAEEEPGAEPEPDPVPATPKKPYRIKSMASPYKEKQAAAAAARAEAEAAGTAPGDDMGGVRLGVSAKTTNAVNGHGHGHGHDHTGDDFISVESSSDDSDDSDSASNEDANAKAIRKVKQSPKVVALLTLCKTLNLGRVKYRLKETFDSEKTALLWRGHIDIKRPSGRPFEMPPEVADLATPRETKREAREALAKNVVDYLRSHVGGLME